MKNMVGDGCYGKNNVVSAAKVLTVIIYAHIYATMVDDSDV